MGAENLGLAGGQLGALIQAAGEAGNGPRAQSLQVGAC